MARVVLVGNLARLTGNVAEFELSATSVKQLFEQLAALHPEIEPHLREGVAVAVDGQIYQDDLFQPIAPDSEVFLLPQIAGGSGAARVVMDPAATYRRLVPVERLASPITPTDDVYVIAHMGLAHVDVAQWRLRVDGLVERPFELDYAALTALPATEVTAVLECFGNPVEPDVATRRVGNVVWRGVRLAEVLERASVLSEARYVCAEGLDSGSFANVHSDRYVKDLPLARAVEPDVLVAWAMNGSPLSTEHGFPARVFIPGYFGTNAVKWLSRLTLTSDRPESLFTTRLYNRRVDGETRPVRELDVHAVIVAPAEGAKIAPGRHRVTGWAWSAWPVRAVEISTDGGARWHPASVTPRAADHQWQAFTYVWDIATPGRHTLHVRAVDEHGRVQPAAGRNRIHTISVAVA